MKKLLLLLSCVYLTSCGLLWEYRELNEIEDWTWMKSDIQSFDAEIKEKGTYDVILLFRHLQGFPYADVNCQMTMTGTTIELEESFTVPIINDQKEYLGQGAGDMWDVEHNMIIGEQLEAGTYHINIAHGMNRDDLQLVMEVGVMIKKTE